VKEPTNQNKRVTPGMPLVTFLFFSVCLTVVLCREIVVAATDGSLAATSTGDLSLDLSIPNLTQLSGISDLDFGNYSGSGTASQNDDVCVYTNNATGQYKITAKGSGPAFAFTLVNGSHTVPYTVRWNAATGVSGNFALTTNVQSAALSGANTSSVTCSGSNSANFQVNMTQGSLMSVPAGTYTGILTLVLDPV